MRSHFMVGRGLSLACAAAGAAALPDAVRAAPIAFDRATNAAYDDGWQAGENGGFGFGPWNMGGTYNTPVQHALDRTSQHNQLGPSWTLFNPNAPIPPPNFPDNRNPPDDDKDISRAGRSLGLLPGQTFSTVIDNPIERVFYRGYTVQLNTGGGNTGLGGTGSAKLRIGTFEYFSYGRWYAGVNAERPSLFNSDTDAGVRIEVTLDSLETYTLRMTPLDDPTKVFSHTGTLTEPGTTIDWVEYQFYNTDSDFYETPSADGQSATDFYIHSLEIAVLPSPTQWNRDANGSWAVGANWLPVIAPNDPDAVANFLGVITAPRTITLDGNKTVRHLNFDNANSYTIVPGITPGAPSTLTIGEAHRPGFVTTTTGSHRISAKTIFAGSTSMNLAAGTQLTLDGGIEVGAGRNLIKWGDGSLTISGPQTHQSGAALLVRDGPVELNSNAGAPATTSTPAVANLSISMTGDDPIKLGAHQNLAALNIDYTQPGFQTFDLASTPTAFHSLSIHGGDLDAVKTTMAAAIHNAKGDISDGIWDSGLHANSAIGIGKLTDAHGDPYVYIRSTRIGDLNLDGTVTIADFIDLAANFNGTGGWQEGDLNGDTLITISDFIDLAANFNASYLGSVMPISAADQAALSAFAEAHGVAVPEPGVVSFAMIAAGSLIRRRRRK